MSSLTLTHFLTYFSFDFDLKNESDWHNLCYKMKNDLLNCPKTIKGLNFSWAFSYPYSDVLSDAFHAVRWIRLNKDQLIISDDEREALEYLRPFINEFFRIKKNS